MNVKVSGDTPSLLAWLITAAIVLVVGGIIVAQLVWRRRRPAVAEAPAAATLIDEPPAPKHVRSPQDFLHLFIGVIVVAIGLPFAVRASNIHWCGRDNPWFRRSWRGETPAPWTLPAGRSRRPGP